MTVCAGLELGTTSTLAQSQKEPSFSLDNPEQFLSGALDANDLMIRASRLAQVKATHPAVRKLAQTIARDHARVEKSLQRLAREEDVRLDQPSDQEVRRQWRQIKSMAGPDFDKAYLQMVIRDHQRDLAELREDQSALEEGSDLQQLIREKMPMLRHHLEMAQVASRELHLALEDRTGSYPNSVDREAVDVDVRADTDWNDREFLGLPTSNNDGTILGWFPAPSRTVKAGSRESYIARELADGQIDPGVENIEEADQETVGAPATAERESRASRFVGSQAVPRQVLSALREEGWDLNETRVRRTTVFEVESPDGEKIYVTPSGDRLESK